MKGKPNLDAFLSGGKADAAETAPAPTKPASPTSTKPKLPAPTPPKDVDVTGPRITKTIRIAQSLDVKLKEEAFRRTMASGKKVAESDVIEAALLKYLTT